MATRASSPTRSRTNASTTRSSSSRSTGSNPRTPSRTPAKKKQAGGSGVLPALGRGIAAVWRGIAGFVGGIVRSLGHGVADLDPEQRRDGTGLGLVAVGIVIAAAFWFMIPGAGGERIRLVVSTVFGTA